MIKENIAGIVLMLGLSLIIAIGIRWILTFVLIPFLLLLAFLGININFDPDILSTRLSILSFLLALGYLLFGDKFIKRVKND